MITITQFPNKFAKKPNIVLAQLDGAGFRDFALGLTHAVSAKKDAAAVFTLCEFGPDANRKKSNITAVTGIVLDLDGENEPEQLMAALAQLEPYAHCGYTTFQHTEETPRLRIVVPLAQPVTAEEFERDSLALRLAAMLGLTADACCAKAAQVYYLPTKRTLSADCAIIVSDSTTLFDIALLPAQAAKPGTASSSSTSSQTQPIYQQINAIVASQFGGTAPYFFGDKFHITSMACGILWIQAGPLPGTCLRCSVTRSACR